MYRYFDFLIESDLPLPELPEAFEGRAACSFSLQPAQEFVTKDWLHHWRHDDGKTFLSFARDGNTLYLCFPDMAEFRIVSDTGDISCFPLPGITDNTVRHLLLDQVLPRVVGHDGRIVLHASAVAMGGQAILFMGVPWSGKSTLAANCISRGATQLADDCVLLEIQGPRVFSITNYPGSRLWQDSLDALKVRTENSREVPLNPMKKRLIYGEGGHKRHLNRRPAKAIFLLDTAGPVSGNKHISIRRVPGARVIPELLKYTFVLDVLDREKMKEKFHAHGSIARAIPLYQLDYPREYSMLGAVYNAVTEMLSITPTAPCNIQ